MQSYVLKWPMGFSQAFKPVIDHYKLGNTCEKNPVILYLHTWPCKWFWLSGPGSLVVIQEFCYSCPHYVTWLLAPYRAPGGDATCEPCCFPFTKEPLWRPFHVDRKASNESRTRSKSAITHYRLTCLKCRFNPALTQTLKMVLDLNS